MLKQIRLPAIQTTTASHEVETQGRVMRRWQRAVVATTETTVRLNSDPGSISLTTGVHLLLLFFVG